MKYLSRILLALFAVMLINFNTCAAADIRAHPLRCGHAIHRQGD